MRTAINTLPYTSLDMVIILFIVNTGCPGGGCPDGRRWAEKDLVGIVQDTEHQTLSISGSLTCLDKRGIKLTTLDNESKAI